MQECTSDGLDRITAQHSQTPNKQLQHDCLVNLGDDCSGRWSAQCRSGHRQRDTCGVRLSEYESWLKAQETRTHSCVVNLGDDCSGRWLTQCRSGALVARATQTTCIQANMSHDSRLKSEPLVAREVGDVFFARASPFPRLVRQELLFGRARNPCFAVQAQTL